jgi:hypothetical protein
MALHFEKMPEQFPAFGKSGRILALSKTFGISTG